MNYKNLENEGEILDAGERKINALLSNLKRIEAPADFDFKLKARIARANPKEKTAAPFLPALRYVLPLGLVILVSVFVVFNAVYFADRQSVSPIAESQNPAAENRSGESGATITAYKADENISPPTETANVPASIKTDDKNKKAPANSSTVAVEVGVKSKAKISRGKIADENLTGSHESALTPETRIITPPGIKPNQTINGSPNAAGGKSLTVKEVLSQLGVEADFERESWRVKSVVSNSLAERSGVRAGDAVEAIDGERLTDKPLKRPTIEGKKLTIARGTEKIEISLTNKSN